MTEPKVIRRIVLGPCRCQGCGALVVWTGAAWGQSNGRRHFCSLRVEPLCVERCAPPECVRPLGHAGECRPTWHGRDANTCGAWMPLARAACAKRAGHRYREHRSAYALDNAYRAATGRERMRATA